MKEKKQFNAKHSQQLRYRLFFSGISVLELKNEETQKQSLTGLTTRTLDHYRLLVTSPGKNTTQFHYSNFHSRDAMLVRYVRLSVTNRYCIETIKRLVYPRLIMPPPYRGHFFGLARFVCLSVPWRSCLKAIGTLDACNLATAGHQRCGDC